MLLEEWQNKPTENVRVNVVESKGRRLSYSSEPSYLQRRDKREKVVTMVSLSTLLVRGTENRPKFS